MRVSRRQRLVRLLIGAACLILLVVSLMPTVWGVLHVGVYIPALAALVGLLGSLFWPFIRRQFGVFWKWRWFRVLFVLVVLLLILVLLLFIVVSVQMLRAAAAPPPESATVIVLGAAIYDDRPSPMLADRLNAAARYLEANPDSVCIVSGGQGADEDYPEATIMKRYLLELGIEEARIIEEAASTNTYENIEFSANIIRERGLSEITVIATQEFHQYRAQKMAENAGLRGVGACTCRSPDWLLLGYWVREFAAICRFALLGY